MHISVQTLTHFLPSALSCLHLSLHLFALKTQRGVLSNLLNKAEPWYDSLAMGEIVALGSPWRVAFIPGARTSPKAWKEGTCTVPVQVSVEMSAKINPALLLASTMAAWSCRDLFFSSATGPLTLAGRVSLNSDKQQRCMAEP